jgi:hypothetical protein
VTQPTRSGHARRARPVRRRHATADEAAAALGTGKAYLGLPVRTRSTDALADRDVRVLEVEPDDEPFVEAAIDMGLHWFGQDQQAPNERAWKTDYEFFGIPTAWLADPSKLQPDVADPLDEARPAKRLLRSTAMKLHLVLAHDVEGRPGSAGAARPFYPQAFATVVGLRAYNQLTGDVLERRARDRITGAVDRLEKLGLARVTRRTGGRWHVTLRGLDGLQGE